MEKKPIIGKVKRYMQKKKNGESFEVQRACIYLNLIEEQDKKVYENLTCVYVEIKKMREPEKPKYPGENVNTHIIVVNDFNPTQKPKTEPKQDDESADLPFLA